MAVPFKTPRARFFDADGEEVLREEKANLNAIGRIIPHEGGEKT